MKNIGACFQAYQIMSKTKKTIKKQTPFMEEVNKELSTLASIVKAFESFDEEARSRNMRYLVNRFSKYVPSHY